MGLWQAKRKEKLKAQSIIEKNGSPAMTYSRRSQSKLPIQSEARDGMLGKMVENLQKVETMTAKLILSQRPPIYGMGL